MIKIKLSNDILKQIDNGYLKTKTIIKFILDNIKGTTTDKAIDNTALQDINFNGKHCYSAYFQGDDLILKTK